MPRKDAEERRRRERTPKYREKTIARVLRWQKKNPDKYRARKNERAARHAKTEERLGDAHTKALAELSTLRKQSLKRPALTYIDPHGKVTIEKELSAEELIRRWKKEHPEP